MNYLFAPMNNERIESKHLATEISTCPSVFLCKTARGIFPFVSGPTVSRRPGCQTVIFSCLRQGGNTFQWWETL